MSSALIAFMIAVGAGTWVYTKSFNKTGGNNKSAITAAVAVGLLLFFVAWYVFSLLMSESA
jgi:hypothetical protein